MVLLRKLTLRTQRELQLVDSATEPTTAGIHRNLETGITAYNELCGTMRDEFVQKAVKD
jgi:hypothetical protein